MHITLLWAFSSHWDWALIVSHSTTMYTYTAIRITYHQRQVSTAIAYLLEFWRYNELWPGLVAKMYLASTAYCWTLPSFAVSFTWACLVASAVELEKSLIQKATLSWRYSRRVSVQFGFLAHWISGARWRFGGVSASGWLVSNSGFGFAPIFRGARWWREWGSEVSHFFFPTTKPKAGELRQEVGHEVAAEVGMSSRTPEY